MGYCCKGICEEYKGKKVPNGSRYEIGQKRCSMCSVFLTISSVRCPCCGAILRTKSRTKKNQRSKVIGDKITLTIKN